MRHIVDHQSLLHLMNMRADLHEIARLELQQGEEEPQPVFRCSSWSVARVQNCKHLTTNDDDRWQQIPECRNAGVASVRSGILSDVSTGSLQAVDQLHHTSKRAR